MVTCSATQYYVVRGVALAHLELHDNYLLFIIYYCYLASIVVRIKSEKCCNFYYTGS